MDHDFIVKLLEEIPNHKRYDNTATYTDYVISIVRKYHDKYYEELLYCFKELTKPISICYFRGVGECEDLQCSECSEVMLRKALCRINKVK